MTNFSVWLLFFSLFSSASGIALSTALLVVFGSWTLRDHLREIPSVPLFWPIVFFILAAIASILFAEGTGFGKPLGKLRYFAFYFLLALYFAYYQANRARLAWAGTFLAFALLVIATLQFLGIFCPLQAFRITPAPLVPFYEDENYLHARGLLYHHNPFGYTSLLLYYLLLGQALESPVRRQRLWTAAGAIALLPAIALSGSRGAWLAWGISTVAVVVVCLRGRWKPLILSLGAIGLLALCFTPPLADRLQTIRLQGNGDRLRYWEICWDIFKDNPVLGAGYHHGFEVQREKYMRGPEETENPRFATDPHSLYFDLLATTGIVGSLAFALFLFCAFRSYLLAWRKNLLPAERATLVTGIGSLTAFCVGAAFDSHFFHTQTLMATLFFLGLGQSVAFQYSPGFGNTRRLLQGRSRDLP